MKSSSFRRVLQSRRAHRLPAYTLSVRHLLLVDDGRFQPRRWHYLLIKICLLTNGISRLRYCNTSRWASRNKSTCCILSSPSLGVRLCKATEAELLSRMIVFTAVLLKARIFCHVMKCRLVNSYRPMKTLQPVQTFVIVYRQAATCDKTNCRWSSAKRLPKSIFIKVQINQITQRCYLWNYIYLDIHVFRCLVKQHKNDLVKINYGQAKLLHYQMAPDANTDKTWFLRRCSPPLN